MEIQKFLERVFLDLSHHKINVDRFQMDHLCFRVASQNEYEKYKSRFLEFADLMIEIPVDGRLISYFELKMPFVFDGRVLRVIELPAPKEGSPYSTGFEHAEFVVDQSFEDIQNLYPSLNWRISNNAFNAKMDLRLTNCNVKFHHIPLRSVIELKKNKELFQEIYTFLEALSPYAPLVSGSVPLNIHNERSDLDIVCSAKDLEQFSKDLSLFAERYSPEISFKYLARDESSIVRFSTELMKYECVAQKRPVFGSIANQHFLIESRLLNIVGDEDRIEIYKLKKRGFATEPAFAQHFRISGEPYEALFQMNSLSETKLFQLYGRQFR